MTEFLKFTIFGGRRLAGFTHVLLPMRIAETLKVYFRSKPLKVVASRLQRDLLIPLAKRKQQMALVGPPSTLLLSLFAAKETDNADASLLSEVDALHEAGREPEAYAKLKAAIGSGAANQSAALHWRLAREARAMANSHADSEEARRSYTYEAFDMAQRGLQLEPDCWCCHKWMGILLDLTGRLEGTKKRIQNSFLVKEHFRRAVAAKPDDATVLHCLGVWCFEVADLPWYQQRLAAAFFATPPTSTYDEALLHLLRAEQASPNFYSSNLLYIGKAYLRKGDKQQARQFLQRALLFDGDSYDDRQSKQEAEQLLKSC